ncbi:unnamed protein product [Fraxinus pennsylvanica]|uniref:Zinc-finger domain-containing protein n=1 Tax=Fraxinus pennsylvanica TaxID=56036 RepID=A0AAD1YZR9_9LAMI|nr:unnamed protein product [Fraxinus pennsylvanica]
MLNLRSIETLENVNTKENDNGPNQKISEYEWSREQRIKENFQRMQKLGILDLSLKVKSLKPTPKITKHRKIPQIRSPSPLPPSGPVRRSSRLQNATPVTYSEVHLAKKDKSLELEDDFLREQGSKPEIYTEEHEKLLGNTERSWTCFVDGYGKDGKRIYDPVRGKTCHQCRQKTLGYRTHCSQCNMVQGQFCGDCLYMRYGENVLETLENPNWICPVCRGICNCSLCRQAKGWPPTGTLYRKISSLGFKSVAHYLIQTQRSNTRSDENVRTKVPVSAKRSLPFSDTQATLAEDDLSKFDGQCQGIDPQFEENRTDIIPNDEKVEVIYLNTEQGETKGAAPDDREHDDDSRKPKNPELLTGSPLYQSNNMNIGVSILEHENHKKEEIYIVDNENFLAPEHDQSNMKVKDPDSVSDSPFPCSSSSVSISEIEKLKKEDITCMVDKNSFLAVETSPKSRKKRACTTELTSDSVAGRLRQRRMMKNASLDLTRWCGGGFAVAMQCGCGVRWCGAVRWLGAVVMYCGAVLGAMVVCGAVVRFDGAELDDWVQLCGCGVAAVVPWWSFFVVVGDRVVQVAVLGGLVVLCRWQLLMVGGGCGGDGVCGDGGCWGVCGDGGVVLVIACL